MAHREPKPYLLLVEGNDDLHVMYALMEHHKVRQTFDIIDCKGISPLLERIPADLRLRQRLGLIVDADERLQSRWEAIKRVLTKEGYTGLPEAPEPGGTILSCPGKSLCGIWLMPDNKVPGKLDDFVSFLVHLASLATRPRHPDGSCHHQEVSQCQCGAGRTVCQVDSGFIRGSLTAG